MHHNTDTIAHIRTYKLRRHRNTPAPDKNDAKKDQLLVQQHG